MNYKNYYEGKIILITGGAGAVGSRLVKSILDCNPVKIVILDNLLSGFEWNLPQSDSLIFIKGDIRNDDDLRRVFHHSPTIVFHLAAFFANQNSVDYPIISDEVNCIGLLKLLEYCVISSKIEKFVYTNSEGGAYGEECATPLVEDSSTLVSGSPYYISKMAGESYCFYYHKFYGLPVSVVRLFNSYGPGEVPGQYRNVIPNFIYWSMKGMPIPLTGGPSMSRDFVFVDDTVEGIMRAGFYKDAVGVPVNIASGKDTFIYEMADQINLITGNNAGVKILNRRKWDTRNRILGSNDRCLEILKFKPSTTFDDGLEKTIKWFSDNWDNIEKSQDFPVGISSALDV